MRKRRPMDREEGFCCALSSLLARMEDPSGHLRAARRELLLFLKEIVDAELARTVAPPRVPRSPAGRAPAGARARRRPAAVRRPATLRRVRIRQV